VKLYCQFLIGRVYRLLLTYICGFILADRRGSQGIIDFCGYVRRGIGGGVVGVFLRRARANEHIARTF
jgi:hypothetical protein